MASMMGSTSFFGSTVNKQTAFSTRRVSPISVNVVAGWGRLPKIGGGKKWEKPDLTANGKVVRGKVHVKKGDTVQVGQVACVRAGRGGACSGAQGSGPGKRPSGSGSGERAWQRAGEQRRRRRSMECR